MINKEYKNKENVPEGDGETGKMEQYGITMEGSEKEDKGREKIIREGDREISPLSTSSFLSVH